MAKKEKTVAHRRLVHPDPDLGSKTTRWLLRRLCVCSCVVPNKKLFDAAVRGGAATDDLEAAEAFFFLQEYGWIEMQAGVYRLTSAGRDVAERAQRLSKTFGDPPMAIPECCLPKLSWIDDE